MFLNKLGIYKFIIVNLQGKRKQKRMKSIKEKSEEYADEQDLRMAYNGSCDNCRQGFVEGANYVLEQVEKLICQKHVEGNLPLFDLTRFIDKLKEK